MDFPNEHNVVQEPKGLTEKQDFQTLSYMNSSLIVAAYST